MFDNVVLLQGTNQGHRRKEGQCPFTLINLTKKKHFFDRYCREGGGAEAPPPLNPPLNFGIISVYKI